MRKREEIFEDYRNCTYYEHHEFFTDWEKVGRLFLEVLLDIRDLLKQTPRTKKVKENKGK